MIEKAQEKEEEAMAWDLYLVQMPNSDKQMTFSDYLTKLRAQTRRAAPKSKKSTADIIGMAERIKQADRKRTAQPGRG